MNQTDQARVCKRAVMSRKWWYLRSWSIRDRTNDWLKWRVRERQERMKHFLLILTSLRCGGDGWVLWQQRVAVVLSLCGFSLWSRMLAQQERPALWHRSEWQRSEVWQQKHCTDSSSTESHHGEGKSRPSSGLSNTHTHTHTHTNSLTHRHTHTHTHTH